MKNAAIFSVSCFMLVGCASITTGTSQNITVDTKPVGAECNLTNDDGTWQVIETPATITVARSYDPLNVVCQKGRLSGTTSVVSKTKGVVYGNIVFGGIIGGAVDMANGAAYQYPSQVFVTLK